MDESRFRGEAFEEFINSLIEDKRFKDKKEEGIAKFVLDKGYKELSEKQKFVFRESLSHYTQNDCSRCGLEIPWEEMYESWYNGGFCGGCAHQINKEKD